MKKWWACVLIAAVAVVMSGCKETKPTPGGPGATNTNQKPGSNPENSFTLEPSNVTVKQGQTADLKIKVERTTNFNGDIDVKFQGVPEGVTISPEPAAIPRDQTETTFKVTADQTAAVGKATVDLLGNSSTGGAEGKSKFELDVKAGKGAGSVPTGAAFNIDADKSLTLKQGETKDYKVTVKRPESSNYNVTVMITGLPKGVTVSPKEHVVKPADSEIQFQITAADDAAPNTYDTAKVGANSPAAKGLTQPLKLTIKKK